MPTINISEKNHSDFMTVKYAEGFKSADELFEKLLEAYRGRKELIAKFVEMEAQKQ